MIEVIEAVSRFPEGITPKDLRVLLPNVSNVDEYLRRAHDGERIRKLARGLYAPVRSVSSVSSDIANLTQLTQITAPRAPHGSNRCAHCAQPLHPSLVDAGEIMHPECIDAAWTEIEASA